MELTCKFFKILTTYNTKKGNTDGKITGGRRERSAGADL